MGKAVRCHVSVDMPMARLRRIFESWDSFPVGAENVITGFLIYVAGVTCVTCSLNGLAHSLAIVTFEGLVTPTRSLCEFLGIFLHDVNSFSCTFDTSNVLRSNDVVLAVV